MRVRLKVTTRQRLRKPGLRRQEALAGYLFVAPQVIGFLVFLVGPIVAVFVFAMQDRTFLGGSSGFVGFENYQTMFSDPLFLQSLRTSAIFTASGRRSAVRPASRRASPAS